MLLLLAQINLYSNIKGDDMKHDIQIVWERARLIITALGGYVGAFVGGADGLLTALVIMMGADYLSGLMSAFHEKQLNSRVGFKGIARKALMLILVGAANILDARVIGTGAGLRTAVICFYISNEALSLFENAARLGLPVPEKLKEALKQLHGEEMK